MTLARLRNRTIRILRITGLDVLVRIPILALAIPFA